MDILVINGSLNRGNGIDTVISTTLRRIHELNPEVNLELLCNATDGLLEDSFPTATKVTVTGIPKLFGYHAMGAISLSGYIHSDDNTILHIHHPVTTLPILTKKGKKVATWHGNNNENWNSWGFGPMPKRIMRRVFIDFCTHMFRTTDKIVAISDYLRNQLINSYGMNGRKVERIYWGIDTNTFVGNGEDKEYMLFVGRHVPYKNIKTLIELSRTLNFPLVCVGEESRYRNIEDYALEINAPVEFKGKVPLSKLIGLYQGCSFYVTASKWEGFGLPPLEAAACEKAAIVPNNTAHTETVKHSVTGLLYDDFKGLRDAASLLIKNPGRRIEMGKAARTHVQTNFTIDSTAGAYLDLYGNLLKG